MADRKKVIWNILSVIIAAVTIWAVFRFSGDISPADIISELRSARPLMLAAALAASFMYVGFEALSLRALLRGAGHRSGFLRPLLYSSADCYFSAVTPSATGGQPASAYFMTLCGIPAGTSVVILMVNLILYTLATLALGLVPLFTMPRLFAGFRDLSKLLIILGYIILSLLAVFFMTCLRNADMLRRPLEWTVGILCRMHLLRNREKHIADIDRLLDEYKKCASVIKGEGKAIITAFLMNLGQRASQIAVPVFVYLALGGDRAAAGGIFSAQCFVTVGYNCVPVPGSMGIADMLMIDAFTDLIGSDAAFTLEMISRGISFYLCTVFSGLVCIAGYIILRRRRDKEKL